MKTHLLTLGLVALAASPLGCHSRQEKSPTTSTTTLTWAEQDTGFPVPSGSTLVANSATQITAFPEELATGSGKGAVLDTVIGLDATDRRYETSASYADVVRFYDKELPVDGFGIADRSSTGAATIWSVRCPDRHFARVAVRDTSPTTVEVVRTEAEELTPAHPKSP